MCDCIAYHVVTDRPMAAGQIILFDAQHRSGVYRRVMEKVDIVHEIYAHPDKYETEGLEHHTSVALRELALEEVRKEQFPQYPSRLGCLYVSENLSEAVKWSQLFLQWGRPTYHIVKIRILGNTFTGDANNCFRGSTNKQENLRLAERYWRNEPNPHGEEPIREILAGGRIEVMEIVKEINGHLSIPTAGTE